jgi:hypothetical protein
MHYFERRQDSLQNSFDWDQVEYYLLRYEAEVNYVHKDKATSQLKVKVVR